MSRIRSDWRTRLAVGVVAGLSWVWLAAARAQTSAPAAAPAPERKILLKQDTAVAGREAVMASVTLPPGSREGRHTHFADVCGFVVEGAVVLDIEGQPTKTYQAGDVFTIPQGKIHEGHNDGKVPARVNAVFFAEKGKPLTTPAP